MRKRQARKTQVAHDKPDDDLTFNDLTFNDLTLCACLRRRDSAKNHRCPLHPRGRLLKIGQRSAAYPSSLRRSHLTQKLEFTEASAGSFRHRTERIFCNMDRQIGLLA